MSDPGDGQRGERPPQRPERDEPPPATWRDARLGFLRETRWGPGGRHQRGRPPWWPEGEAWPPADWRNARRAFLRRVGCFFGIVAGLLLVADALAAWLIFGRPDHWPAGSGPPFEGGDRPGPPFGFFGVVLLIIIIVVVGRAVRRTAAPIADVMAAADRVAAGDYTVRVETSASGEVGRLVDSFNAMTSRLEVNEVQRRNLLADVAHELRTPLAVIQGNVEGMLDGVYPRDDERLGSLLEETTVMARLLEDLRTLSMAEAGALRLHREPTDVAELIDDVLAAHRPRAKAGGVALSSSVAPLPTLEVDPVRVREVLGNLLTNALRHTPVGGSIRIEVAQDNRSALFSVADTGTGIAPDDLPRIFDRLWKSADSGGSGLGLAIAKSLVEAHGGEIRAESRAGHGTTIRFTLPFDISEGLHQSGGPRQRAGAPASADATSGQT